MSVAQTLTDIKSLLAEHGLRPKKKFGQNFLHDGNQMRRILDAADLTPGETVLEVGPGTGALTERLLEAGARVVAVEIDRDLEPILRQRTEPWADRFVLHVGSALAGKHDLSPEVMGLLQGDRFKLVANLPYNVASPLLANLCVDEPAMTAAVVMVQREVADRLTAGPGGKDYGPLGIIVQATCEARTVAVLSPSCFWPAPTVASAVVRLTRRADPVTEDLAEVLLGRARRRAVVVGKIKMRDPKVKRPVDHRLGFIVGVHTPEVVPEPQRDRRQLQPAAPAAAVGHGVVTRVGGCRHGGFGYRV